MQQSGQIRHGDMRTPGKLLHGASATDSRAALQHQDSLIRTRQVRRAGKAVMAARQSPYPSGARQHARTGAGNPISAEDGGRG